MSEGTPVEKLLRDQLTVAEAGKMNGIIIVSTSHDGSVSFSHVSNSPVPVNLLGAVEWAKAFILQAVIEKQKQESLQQLPPGETVQ